jgi:hypothetical protein
VSTLRSVAVAPRSVKEKSTRIARALACQDRNPLQSLRRLLARITEAARRTE